MDSVIQWFILCQHNMLYSDVSMTLWKASLSWWPVSYQKSAYNLFISWLVFFPRRSVQLCLFNCVILPLLQVLPDRWQNYFWLEDYSRCFCKLLVTKFVSGCEQIPGESPRKGLCCSGHPQSVVSGQRAGEVPLGWQKRQTLVPFVKYPKCTLSSLDPF